MQISLIAKVAVSAATYAIDKPYDYLIPPALAAQAKVGMRVIVPFGHGSRLSDGILLSLGSESGQTRIKKVSAFLDEQPVLDGEAIRLALWMRERCFCTVYDAIKAMLPTGLWYVLQDEYAVAPGIERGNAYAAAGKSMAAGVLDLLYERGGKAKLRQIKAAFGETDPGPALRGLVKKGILTVKTNLTRGVGDKTVEILRLSMQPEEALSLTARRVKQSPMRHAVAELLSRLGEAPLRQISYLTGASSSSLRAMVKSGFLISERREELRKPEYEEGKPSAPVVLNEEQSAAYEGIDALCRAGKPAVALLYGVTGSGKTQVYLKLIEKTLSGGKSAMLLVPEIALTPQLLRMVSACFGSGVAVLHSSLRTGERYDEWKRIRSGQARVVVGTRSAVFAPLQNLGLIILDEEQEYTYKSENPPRYHARDVAKYRCTRSNAVLLLGSATPSIESFYKARQGIYHHFTLRRRFNEGTLPRVMIVDMRRELRAGNGGTISSVLYRELSENINAGRQSILFINRRGNSPMVTCGECGNAPVCPHCSVYLTYHSANGRLMCHHCGYSQALPPACPQCGGRLKFIGAGTQKVQEELQTLFPSVEILRMDTDSVLAAGSHEKILSRFEKKQIPILLGTQMIAKGLDFENVTLVGVITADLSLYADDFRASERTFSLLTQVVGRAGRGAMEGRAVIQTYTPQSEVIAFAAAQNYEGFYDSEIRLRKLRGCPPFRDLFTLSFSGENEAAVLNACSRMQKDLQKAFLSQEWRPFQPRMLGPAPAPVVKLNNRYRYRLMIACENREIVRRLLSGVLIRFHENGANKGVSLSIDTNGID